jgi:RNA polymerase sigma factor (sigma-70 family)
MATLTETTLALRIANGDRQAENELFQRYDEQIRFMVQIRLRWKIPSADIDDLIGEIRAAALLSLRKGGYDPEKGNSVGAYLAGITARVISQYFRKQSKIQGVKSDLRAMELSNSGNALRDIIADERDQRIRKCLSRLNSKYKEVLLLRFYEEQTIEEIARTLNLERRRVSERIHYALKKLIDEWKRTN